MVFHPSAWFRADAPIFQLLWELVKEGLQLYSSAAVYCLSWAYILFQGEVMSLRLINKEMQRHQILTSDWNHSEGPPQLESFL